MVLSQEPLELQPLSSQDIGSDQQGRASTRLKGHLLILARFGWFVVALLAMTIYIVALPYHQLHLHIVCRDILCGGSQTAAEVADQLHSLGLTYGGYTAYVMALGIVFALVYFTVAVVIFWHRSDDWMALLVSLFLLTFVLAFTDIPGILESVHSIWWLPVASVGFIGAMTLPLCFYLFPNGRFVPSWMRWLLIGWVGWGIVKYYFPNASFSTSTWYLSLEALAFVVGLGSIVISQTYRFRYVSNLMQRQQTKWVVFGMATGLAGFLSAGFFGFILPPVLSSWTTQPVVLSSALAGIIAISATYLVMLVIPLSIGVAILRYRLYDIDFLINRTAIYIALTGALVVIYGGFIIVLQELFRWLTGQTSEISVVISTLAIAVLFQPLRRRIQTMIDLRFFRHKYNAIRALETFSASLRGEVDLAQLSAQLVAVVHETMQPTSVSLWLRQPKHEEESWRIGFQTSSQVGARSPNSVE